MSEIEKLLMADHGGTEIRIKRMELLWEFNKKMNQIADEKNQKSSASFPIEPLYDVDSQAARDMLDAVVEGVPPREYKSRELQQAIETWGMIEDQM
jgi:hypothetical protein